MWIRIQNRLFHDNRRVKLDRAGLETSDSLAFKSAGQQVVNRRVKRLELVTTQTLFVTIWTVSSTLPNSHVSFRCFVIRPPPRILLWLVWGVLGRRDEFATINTRVLK
jgi:hypothetical protein